MGGRRRTADTHSGEIRLRLRPYHHYRPQLRLPRRPAGQRLQPAVSRPPAFGRDARGRSLRHQLFRPCQNQAQQPGSKGNVHLTACRRQPSLTRTEISRTRGDRPCHQPFAQDRSQPRLQRHYRQFCHRQLCAPRKNGLQLQARRIQRRLAVHRTGCQPCHLHQSLARTLHSACQGQKQRRI